jgi:hypothetical protein
MSFLLFGQKRVYFLAQNKHIFAHSRIDLIVIMSFLLFGQKRVYFLAQNKHIFAHSKNDLFVKESFLLLGKNLFISWRKINTFLPTQEKTYS